MVAICHNMDLGDSWEHADDPEYPEKFSALGIRHRRQLRHLFDDALVRYGLPGWSRHIPSNRYRLTRCRCMMVSPAPTSIRVETSAP